MEESFEHLINFQSSLSLPCVNLQSAIWGDEFMRTVSDSCLDLDLFTAELRAAWSQESSRSEPYGGSELRSNVWPSSLNSCESSRYQSHSARARVYIPGYLRIFCRVMSSIKNTLLTFTILDPCSEDWKSSRRETWPWMRLSICLSYCQLELGQSEQHVQIKLAAFHHWQTWACKPRSSYEYCIDNIDLSSCSVSKEGCLHWATIAALPSFLWSDFFASLDGCHVEGWLLHLPQATRWGASYILYQGFPQRVLLLGHHWLSDVGLRMARLSGSSEAAETPEPSPSAQSPSQSQQSSPASSPPSPSSASSPTKIEGTSLRTYWTHLDILFRSWQLKSQWIHLTIWSTHYIVSITHDGNLGLINLCADCLEHTILVADYHATIWGDLA